ncbi:GH3 auxin-responsive promoter family protein [Geitlerinema sp. PCC 7407]|uniref:GH3 auxin-responsive promoter family protein n=1 Tax=Geitlerinema sp. PCC 7407 TaxID=1173025 RepID=UPI00029FD028|nr:GH3 auxin-responsive promoter family protein [Geitlerinema sp. PCC 7407]AFY67548.1 GH3 auxin-responsive promoter [Geitlerinema sp. PCC 7407]
MNRFLSPFVLAIARRAKNRLVAQTRQPEAAQERFLMELLRVQQTTELGRKFGLSDIKTIDQFREQVPIWPYSTYQAYTERAFNGEPNVLTADPIAYFNLTSGSTGVQKLIPVTKRFQNSLKRANLASIGFLADGLAARGRSFGRVLTTNSVQLLGQTPTGIDYGHASVGVLRMGKLLYSQLFAHPFETLLPGDSVTRHYVCLLFALRDRQMRGLLANFPMLVLRTCGYLEEYADQLIRDIEKGELASWLDLSPELRQQLEKRCVPDPVRAQELRVAIQRDGRLTPVAAWPQLAFVGTARGGTSDFYFERFLAYFGDTPVFGAVYSSAEATFSVYPDVDTDGSVLALESGFFEFIAPDQWEEAHPKTLLPTEVQVGGYYRLLTTAYSGFYRYDIGDVVEVVGFYEKTPLIVFRYRRGGMISSTTEKTTEYHITRVMQTLQQEFGVVLEDFCITLSEDVIPAHYLINVELAAGESLADPQGFLDRCDRLLQAENKSYALKRPSNFVPPPRLRILAPGSFGILRRRQLDRGIPDSQLKFPHLSEDRQFLAGLTVLQEVRLPGDGG